MQQGQCYAWYPVPASCARSRHPSCQPRVWGYSGNSARTAAVSVLQRYNPITCLEGIGGTGHVRVPYTVQGSSTPDMLLPIHVEPVGLVIGVQDLASPGRHVTGSKYSRRRNCSRERILPVPVRRGSATACGKPCAVLGALPKPGELLLFQRMVIRTPDTRPVHGQGKQFVGCNAGKKDSLIV